MKICPLMKRGDLIFQGPVWLFSQAFSSLAGVKVTEEEEGSCKGKDQTQRLENGSLKPPEIVTALFTQQPARE